MRISAIMIFFVFGAMLLPFKYCLMEHAYTFSLISTQTEVASIRSLRVRILLLFFLLLFTNIYTGLSVSYIHIK